MFVVIAHLLILNNDVNDICIVYTSPEKSTQLIEYYWDCIPVIGLRPENVHTRNGLGATHMQRYIYFLVWQNPTLHRNDLWRPFRSSYIISIAEVFTIFIYKCSGICVVIYIFCYGEHGYTFFCTDFLCS